MDNRIVALGLGLLVLGGVGTFVVIQGGAGSAPETEEEAQGTVAEQDAPARPGGRIARRTPAADGVAAPMGAEGNGDGTAAAAGEGDGPTVGDPEKWKELRAEKAAKWRADAAMVGQQWVAANLDEARGQQVMSVWTAAQDTIAQTRADLESGAIRPVDARDETRWANEELETQLANLIGKEQADAFLLAIKQGTNTRL